MRACTLCIDKTINHGLEYGHKACAVSLCQETQGYTQFVYLCCLSCISFRMTQCSIAQSSIVNYGLCELIHYTRLFCPSNYALAKCMMICQHHTSLMYTCTRVETVTCTVFLMFEPVYSIIITLSLKYCCRHGQLCHPHVHHMHTCDTCDTKHTCACIVGCDVIIVGIIMFVLIIIITMTECLFHVCSVMTFS